MCAIIDANVVGQIFGTGKSQAAQKFLEWIDSGTGRVVVGGKNFEEIVSHGKAREWIRQGIISGKVHREEDGKVDAMTEKLKKKSSCQSNDPHIIALAQISNARLLYSNDQSLQGDFMNDTLVRNPTGKVYTTLNREFGKAHKGLLENDKLCRNQERKDGGRHGSRRRRRSRS